MDHHQLRSNLKDALSELPNNTNVLGFAIDELCNRLYNPALLSDLLRSKLTVKQVIFALAWLLQKNLVEITKTSEGLSISYTKDAKSSMPIPFAAGLHFIDNASVNENPEYRKIATMLLEAKKNEFSQSIETFASQARRFKMMQALGDCSHNSLLMLGDDALFSLFLATHGVTSEIHVGDVDEDLLEFISDTAAEHGFKNIHTFKYNIFEEIPEVYKNRFDCFSINGFKDLGGLLTFICRGLQCLKDPKNFKTGYFNYGSVDIGGKDVHNLDFEIQKFLTRAGVILEHITPAPESHVDNEVTAALLSVATNVSEQQTINEKIVCCDEGLATIKSEFSKISWVEVENFPNIVLAPLKIAQVRVNDYNEAEVVRFLRLSRIFSK